jgi:hypothetical protein
MLWNRPDAGFGLPDPTTIIAQGSFRVTDDDGTYYFAAAGGVRCAARSFSTAVLQPALRLVCCLSMHASVALSFPIDELQRRNASPTHLSLVSAVQAKLGVERAKTETTKAATRKAWQTVLVKSAIIVGLPSDTLWMSQPCLSLTGLAMTNTRNPLRRDGASHAHHYVSMSPGTNRSAAFTLDGISPSSKDHSIMRSIALRLLSKPAGQ